MAIKASQKAGIVGLSSIRRALRNAPDAIRKEVVKVIEESAAEVAEVERFMAPRSEGDLIQSIAYVVSSDGLSAVVGPGIRGATTIKKAAGSYFATRSLSSRTGKVLNFSKQTQFDRFQLMKGYWLEVGTKKMRRHPFVEPTWDATKHKVVTNVSAAVDIGLHKMVSGGGHG